MWKNIWQCECCYNFFDDWFCNICVDKCWEEGIICVVESICDVMAIEDIGQYWGLYYVLGGVIFLIEGVGLEDLIIDLLLECIEKDEVKELIMAISFIIEGDIMIFYIFKKLEGKDIQVSIIVCGVFFGGELEYVDELILGWLIVVWQFYNKVQF